HYYQVSVPGDHEAVAARLKEEQSVAGAYVKPAVRVDEELLRTSAPPETAVPMALSPDFSSRQGHLDAAPGGVNARTAWGQPGGGLLLIEWQRPGPGSTGLGSAGFLPLEWWPDDFAAIAYATAKGVIVVEPAGNGSVSLDDDLYDTPAPGFPPTWKNPFDRNN